MNKKSTNIEATKTKTTAIKKKVKIKTIDDISEYLSDYEDLWQIIDQNDAPLPSMDVTCDLIEDNNYYGVDFSGENTVYQLFFTGQSNYGPIICFPKNIKANMDECPVYIFDATGDEIMEKIGNFRHYMTTLLKDFIKKI